MFSNKYVQRDFKPLWRELLILERILERFIGFLHILIVSETVDRVFEPIDRVMEPKKSFQPMERLLEPIERFVN